MRFAGSASWSISINSSNMRLEWALWIRAAERIEVPSGGVVTAPPEVTPMPKPTLASSDELAEGWLWWWRTLLNRPDPLPPRSPGDVAELNMFSPPDFPGLADYPALRRVVSARWSETNEWYSNRKRAVVMDFQAARGPGREFEIVRAVEAEIGRKAAPFSLRIIVLPVLEQEIRPVDASTFLVPERVRATAGYDDWLRELVRALA
jgi:hypothetical protein